MGTLFEAVYTFITTYIFPYTEALDWYFYYNGGHKLIIDFPAIFSALVTIGLFWLCIARPIKWLFTYGLFGGSKKNPLTKKRRYDD